MRRNVLVSWLGRSDLGAGEPGALPGPVERALRELQVDEASLLLYFEKDEDRARVDPTLQRLRAAHPAIQIAHRWVDLNDAGDILGVFQSAQAECDRLSHEHQDLALTFHLSPGTPAMRLAWIILGKTRIHAKFVESSPEKGLRRAEIPFEISAELIAIPRLLEQSLAQPDDVDFRQIVGESPAMKRLKAFAARVARFRNVSVLIEGETGTGKELVARAIHEASGKGRPLIPVNCGSISPNLIESELFGHVSGAFTGAERDHRGYFASANGGTLFLDEIGELPLEGQVKLLRVLETGDVMPVGATATHHVDVRVIAATNRSLVSEIARGRFREDLYHRLAGAVIRTPPFRDREGDRKVLIQRFLDEANAAGARAEGNGWHFVPKRLAPGARRVLMDYTWPGNIRELRATLMRAVVWSAGDVISEDEMRDSLQPTTGEHRDGILGRQLGDGLRLDDVLAEVARHYLSRALETAGGNKSRAGRLVGAPSPQTFTNWLKTYGVVAKPR